MNSKCNIAQKQSIKCSSNHKPQTKERNTRSKGCLNKLLRAIAGNKQQLNSNESFSQHGMDFFFNGTHWKKEAMREDRRGLKYRQMSAYLIARCLCALVRLSITFYSLVSTNCCAVN